MSFNLKTFYYTVQLLSIVPSSAITVLYWKHGTTRILIPLSLSLIGQALSNSLIVFTGNAQNPTAVANTTFCRVQGFFTTIFAIMPIFFTLFLSLHLWIVLAFNQQNTDYAYFHKYVIATVFITVVMTSLGISIGDLNDRLNGGTGNSIAMSNFSCVIKDDLGADIALFVPNVMFAVVGIIPIFETTIKIISQKIRTSTRSKIALYMRMWTFCVVYIFLAIYFVYWRIIDKLYPNSPHPAGAIKLPFAFFGFILFLVFGTRKELYTSFWSRKNPRSNDEESQKMSLSQLSQKASNFYPSQ